MSPEHTTPHPLVLASTSPRRKVLLETLGLAFEVWEAALDERLSPGEGPALAVARLAVAKAEAGARAHPGAAVLGADTLVALGERPLGKPQDAADARAMLRLLSGRVHQVWTAVALARLGHETLQRTARSEVTFRDISDLEILTYVDTGEPLDKAGAYAIQGRAAAFVTQLAGARDTVVGLPLAETCELLRAVGIALP